MTIKRIENVLEGTGVSSVSVSFEALNANLETIGDFKAEAERQLAILLREMPDLIVSKDIDFGLTWAVADPVTRMGTQILKVYRYTHGGMAVWPAQEIMEKFRFWRAHPQTSDYAIDDASDNQ